MASLLFCALPHLRSDSQFDTADAARQGLESMKIVTYSDEELVQLATRIPRRIARRLKEFCVRNDVRMQAFVRSALAEKLARSRGNSRQQRRSQA
jgi:hypothetical protein